MASEAVKIRNKKRVGEMKNLGTIKVLTTDNVANYKRLGSTVIDAVKSAPDGVDMHVVAVFGDVALITYRQLPPNFKAAKWAK